MYMNTITHISLWQINFTSSQSVHECSYEEYNNVSTSWLALMPYECFSKHPT